MQIEGQVLFGINNIYSVLVKSKIFQCRIKGKVLAVDEPLYNAIASGDFVKIEVCDNAFDEEFPQGQIISKLPPKTTFVRLNKKLNRPQIIASNFDIVVCVTSPISPPFRPRFVDRVAVSVPVESDFLVVLNKSDQGITKEDNLRFCHYKKLGYKTHICSAQNGSGIKELAKILNGKVALFVGQSGVGKSSLINALRSDVRQKTAEVSAKFNKGRHTTNFAILFPDAALPLIDSPGIREIDVYGIKSTDLYHYFPDLNCYQGKCRFDKCTHTNEPNCAVIEAVEKGLIDSDRYKSYLNLLNDIIYNESKNDYR